MKGIIADIKDNRAILIADGKFINIPDKGYSVGQTIEYNERSYTHLVKAVSAAAAAVVLSVGGYKAYFTPYSCIDIDINPSVRVEINVLDRVISMKPLNDDAVRLLEVCPKQSGSIDECLEEIISESEKMGFLNTDNNSINMEIVSTHKKPFEAASRYSGTYIADGIEIVGAVQSADKETLEKAKELDISVGRLKAIQSYSDAYGGDSENNAKALNELPTKEIEQLAKEKPADNDAGKSKLPVQERQATPPAEVEVKAEKSIKNNGDIKSGGAKNSGTKNSGTKNSGTKKNTSAPAATPSASFASLPDNKPSKLYITADNTNQADEAIPIMKQPQWSNNELSLSVPTEAPSVSENDRDEGAGAVVSGGGIKLPRPEFDTDKEDKNEAESNENKYPVNGNNEGIKPESDDREGNKGTKPDAGYGDNDRDDDKNNDRDDVTDNDRDDDKDDEKTEYKPDGGKDNKKPLKEPDKEGTQNNSSEGDGGLSSSGKPSSDKNDGTQSKPSTGEGKPTVNEKPGSGGKTESESKPTVNEKPGSDGKTESESKPTVNEKPGLGGKTESESKPTVNEKPGSGGKTESESKPSVNEKPGSGGKTEQQGKSNVNEKPSGEKSSKESGSSGNKGTQNKSSESPDRSTAPAGADRQRKPDGDSLRASSNDKALIEK